MLSLKGDRSGSSRQLYITLCLLSVIQLKQADTAVAIASYLQLISSK